MEASMAGNIMKAGLAAVAALVLGGAAQAAQIDIAISTPDGGAVQPVQYPLSLGAWSGLPSSRPVLWTRCAGTGLLGSSLVGPPCLWPTLLERPGRLPDYREEAREPVG